MKLKRYVFKKHFQGLPKKTDFQLVEEDIPQTKEEQVHFEALFISIDQYMRTFAPVVPLGKTMFGTQVARVIESKHSRYKEGDLVVGHFGWTTHCVVNPDEVKDQFGDLDKPYLLPDLDGFSPSLALGILGMPGNTAHFGLFKICKPKPHEVLVVSGAAGAIGSHVGQLGKILGLTVIGFVGSDEKVKLVKEKLKFDYAYNYKTKTISSALQESAPYGVDCYFDNVGGRISSEIMRAMNMYGRVAICGSNSIYYSDPEKTELAPVVQPSIVYKQLALQGFLSSKCKESWAESLKQNLQYLKEGKLEVLETVIEGFENLPTAFVNLFTCSTNVGKLIVKVDNRNEEALCQ